MAQDLTYGIFVRRANCGTIAVFKFPVRIIKSTRNSNSSHFNQLVIKE